MSYGSKRRERLEEETFSNFDGSIRPDAPPPSKRGSNTELLNLMVALSTPKSIFSVDHDDTQVSIFFELVFQVASPIGLMANLASVVSVTGHWRMQRDGVTIPDLWWVMMLNSMALAFGCVANIVLFLHMQLWVTRYVSLFITAVSYLLATFLYMAMLGATEYVYFSPKKGDLHRTEAYWHGVIGSCLYFLSAIAIIGHSVYFWGRKYNFDTTKQQNMLMRLCIVYIVWIGAGAAVFSSRSLINISYADSLYFCVVASLTLGYGDILPTNDFGRALVIPFIIGSAVWGGLVTINVFHSSISDAGARNINAIMLSQRKQALEQFHTEDVSESDGTIGKGPAGILTFTKKSLVRIATNFPHELNEGLEDHPQDYYSFCAMKEIRKNARQRSIRIRTVLALIWLPAFWLIGALIFKCTEGWDYFHAFYMCSLSLTAVGFGDYTPTSPGGRSVFVYWALVALPTMTVAISNLTSFFESIEERTPSYVRRVMRNFNNEKQDELAQELYQIRLTRLTRCVPAGNIWDEFVKVIDGDDKKGFEYSTWREIVCALIKTKTLPIDFWLSDISPLRMSDIKERRFLLLAGTHVLYGHLEQSEMTTSLNSLSREQSKIYGYI